MIDTSLSGSKKFTIFLLLSSSVMFSHARMLANDGSLKESIQVIETEKREKSSISQSKVLQCWIEDNLIELKIDSNKGIYLRNQESFLVEQIKDQPSLEDLQFSCKENLIFITYKKPLSNQKWTLKYEYSNQRLKFIEVQSFDDFQLYINQSIEMAMKGEKNKIKDNHLIPIPFAYQYINVENLSSLLDESVAKTKSESFQKRLQILESVAILTTQWIFYYIHADEVNLREFDNYKVWTSAWESIGLDNYDAFLLEYAKVLLKTQSNKGIEVLKFLKSRFPNNLEVMMVLGDHYWEKGRKDLAIDIYRDLVLKKQTMENWTLEYQTQELPAYIYKRLNYPMQ
ncbi:MAG: hypothetical protein NZ853_06415 [Leptospiraceae bacterium]|nr:hypothetical protein [Leptospiraceae bacterium]MDW7976415.1 hypothetical protein [Leptospiraceae bacterium]